ncbi:GNAT family N-acetyltransferase [Psychromonas sp.]|uniref:GNAT family N-acetyltransferase n=1 Tax=Psychromonas sp. TaxID=1884585 RepID=UPI003565915B
MVSIEKLSDAHIESVLKITLAEEQMKFAGAAEEFLADGNDTTHLHVIKSYDEVVGFFKIDITYAFTHEFCADNGIALRTFVIDVNHQGKGIGTASVKALFSYLKANYSAYNSIYLTVNCLNRAAQACYQKGGFEITGEKYLGGEAGPQHIMRGKINGP